MLISVIVPVFNGSKFLETLVNKMLCQDFNDFELILVNDGSSDNSLEIMERLSTRDKRIVLVDKKNGGICDARNYGLNVAKGDWISFVDQDDDLPCDMLVSLASGIDDSVDLVIGGKRMLLIDNNDEVIDSKTYQYGDAFIEKSDFIYHQVDFYRNHALSHIWNCLYRRRPLKEYGISFNTKFTHGFEDCIFNFEFSGCCRRIRFVSPVVYQYNHRKAQSTSFKYNPSFFDEYCEFISVISRAIGASKDEKHRLLLARMALKHTKTIFRLYCLKKTKEDRSYDFSRISGFYSSKIDYKITIGACDSFVDFLYCSFLSFALKHKRGNLFSSLCNI